MSSDNGVYILQTAGPEFRVIYAMNIDDIYGTFNDETFQWDGNTEVIHDFFFASPVFDNLEMALDFAEEISHNHDYLEYGICLITDFKDLVFNE